MQPLLTPALAQIGFRETTLQNLNPFEQRRLCDIDQRQHWQGRDFRDGEDRLIYQKEQALMKLRPYPRKNSTLYDTHHPFSLIFRFDLEDHPEMRYESSTRLIPSDEGLCALGKALTQQLSRSTTIARADGMSPSNDTVATTFWEKFEPEESPLQPKINQLYFTLWLFLQRKLRGYIEGEEKQCAITDLSHVMGSIANFTTLYMKKELQVYDSLREIGTAFATSMTLSLGG